PRCRSAARQQRGEQGDALRQLEDAHRRGSRSGVRVFENGAREAGGKSVMRSHGAVCCAYCALPATAAPTAHVGCNKRSALHRCDPALKFTIANGAKDYGYYTHMLEQAGVPAFIAEAVHQSYVQANALGLGERYIASMI